MSGKYRVERIGYPEFGKLAELYSECFGRQRNVDFFKWKYLDNPAGEAVCVGAMRADEILGSCAMIPEGFNVFGQTKKIYKCCDLMVSPRYRKQGISTGLIRSLIDQISGQGPLFLYTFCGKNATPSFLKNKWLKLDSVDYYFKTRYQLKLKFLFGDLNRLYAKNILRKMNSFSVLEKDYKFPKDDSRIHVLKDAGYLRWRLKNPKYNYRIIGYYDNDVIKGYVIYNADINQDVYIVDLGVSANNAKVIKTLLGAVELDARGANARLVLALAVRNTNFHDIVKNNGYMRNPFRKGPLQSRLDFDILIEAGHDGRAFDKSYWDLSGINYDDI